MSMIAIIIVTILVPPPASGNFLCC